MERIPDHTAAPEEEPDGQEVWDWFFELQDENERLRTLVRQLAGFSCSILEETGLVSV